MQKASAHDKAIIFLSDYKEGFNELSKMVQDFEGITPESQEMYLKCTLKCLKEQLDLIDQKKTKVLEEVKEFLAKYNSQFKALLDTEKHILGQLEYYKTMRTVITNDDGQQENGKAAI